MDRARKTKVEKDDGDKDKDAPDYYYENGFMVFTEAYHLKRGYCCKNNCRHCPWRK